MHNTYFVYLLASRRNGTLYAGVTDDLMRRVAEHREHIAAAFTRTYDVTRLVWFEPHDSIEAAIVREKQIKKWKRAWKIELFRELNPHWDDLFPALGKGIW
ncbi:MAG: GIY-YIG nuclease family protein [Hyphomicrobiales bacterium]|nr:MAG: GIY-YIG nuclease family protein [Hyphomicrobiales bacterium]